MQKDKLALRTRGYALRLDCDYLLLEEKVPIISTAGAGMEERWSMSPDPSQAGGQMQGGYTWMLQKKGPGF